jgi:hypothetical protein
LKEGEIEMKTRPGESRESFCSRFLILLILSVLSPASVVFAQTTTFTYQGRFTDGSTAANGTYDMQFKLFDSSVGAANQIGSTIANGAVIVSNGVFTVPLDFGGAGFSGADRFLEIGVRLAGDGNAYTILSPRQQLTSAVYAIRAGSATVADSATTSTQLGGVAASQFVQTNDSRLTDARTPSAGSSDYIQNSTNAQAANFNISGNGKADTLTANGYFMNSLPALILDSGNNIAPPFLKLAPSGAKVVVGGDLLAAGTVSANQYNINGVPVLSVGLGLDNTAVGAGTGRAGSANSFFGSNAGRVTTVGFANAFFGSAAGSSNTAGQFNSTFGAQAGETSTNASNLALFGFNAGRHNTASESSFFGGRAGESNTSGLSNSFFGFESGLMNTTGGVNSFYGYRAGRNNTASGNSFFGASAGSSNINGDSNSFFGGSAGLANTVGDHNSFFGRSAGQANTGGSSNSFFGADAGLVNTKGGANSFFGSASGSSTTTGDENAFFGFITGEKNTTGAFNTFIGSRAGTGNTGGKANAFFGGLAGISNTTGDSNTLIGYGTDVGSGNLFNATAIGAKSQVAQSNSIVLGGISGVNGGTDTNVGIGTNSPSEKLTVKTATSGYGVVHTDGTITVGTYVGGSSGGGWFGTKSNHSLSFFVNDGSPSMTIEIGGTVKINTLGAAGSTSLCRNALNQISTCSSSLRYKKHIQPFIGGLSVLNRLRPITFDWKQGGMHDLGFGAEDVAAIEPLLVTRNETGEVEGVKYDRISAVLVNAVQEQQQQISQQQAQLKLQRDEIESLKKLVCRHNRRAPVCK